MNLAKIYSSSEKKLSREEIRYLIDKKFVFSERTTERVYRNYKAFAVSLKNNFSKTIKYISIFAKYHDLDDIDSDNIDLRTRDAILNVLHKNNFIVSKKNLECIEYSHLFLIASLHNDYNRTIIFLNDVPFEKLVLTDKQIKEILDCIFNKYDDYFTNLPNCLKNIVIKYLNDAVDEEEFIIDLLKERKIPISYFTSSALDMNYKILGSIIDYDELEFVTNKIEYSSGQYNKEDEEKLVSLLKKKNRIYSECSTVEDILKVMGNFNLTREEMCVSEIVALSIYAGKVLKGYSVNSIINMFGYEKDMKYIGVSNRNNICLCINSEINNFDEILNTINHEIEHVIQKKYIENCRIDLDNDIDLYCKDRMLRQVLVDDFDYYSTNYNSMSYEYDAEFKANIRSAKILGLYEKWNQKDVEKITRYKSYLMQHSKKNMEEYSYEVTREYRGLHDINELFEYVMSYFKEKDENKYLKLIEENPIIKYEYNYINQFKRKTIEELIIDLDESETKKDKGIYYNLLKIRLNIKREEDVENNAEIIKCVLESDRFEGVTKKILQKLVELSNGLVSRKYEGYMNRINRNIR